jgi:hypothetical protein
LASKLEEAPKKFRDVLMVFARIDSRAKDRPPELLDPNSQVLTDCQVPPAQFARVIISQGHMPCPVRGASMLAFAAGCVRHHQARPVPVVILDHFVSALQRFEHLKQDVFRVEKSMLRAFGFVTHVEHPHKFVLSLVSILDMPELLQREAWNLTNDR